jgi:uncharacterized protein YyaL (SSP411 family)
LENSAGGFYDVPAQDSAALRVRLSLIEQNGAAASFLLRVGRATGDAKYRAAARHALSGYTGEFASYGVHCAPVGTALGEFLSAAKT